MDQIREEEKFCTGCQSKHPLSSFNKRRQSKDGLESQCRVYRKERRMGKFRKDSKLKKPDVIANERFSTKEVKEVLKEVNEDQFEETDQLVSIKSLETWSFTDLIVAASRLGFEDFPKDKCLFIKMMIKKEYPEPLFSKDCGKCKKVLPISQFSRHIRTRYDLSIYCKSCDSQKSILYLKTSRGFVNFLLNGAKWRAKVRREKGRKEDSEFTITPEGIEKMITEKPYIEMLPNFQLYPGPGRDWSVSLDRIDDNKGYTPENIRLFPLEMNHTTKWTQEKLRSILKYAYDNPLSDREIEDQLQVPYDGSIRLYKGPVQYEGNLVKCRFCGEWKTSDNYNKKQGRNVLVASWIIEIIERIVSKGNFRESLIIVERVLKDVLTTVKRTH
jgi:hypothetical protein